MRFIRQLVILAEVLTRFCCLSSCRTPACKSSPLAMAGSSQGMFILSFPWQMTGSMYDGMLACGLPTVNRLPCAVRGRPWTTNTRIFLGRLAFYRCSQKSCYFQGHVAHHMRLERWCGQVCKVHLNNRSSHLTQPVIANWLEATLVQLQRSSAGVFSCQSRQVDGLFWQRTSVSPLHASRNNWVCNQDTCVTATFGQKLGLPAGLSRQTHLGSRSNDWAPEKSEINANRTACTTILS